MAQKTKNERITENLVRDAFRDLAYFAESSDIRVEEQKSNIEAVKRLMRSASKSGQGGGGSPEFIISSASTPDFLLIVECKADTKDHFSAAIADVLNGNAVEESPGQYVKRTQRFAVDGVLHYAERLAKEFNVIALAVSGDTNSSLKISTYLHPKKADSAKVLVTKGDQELDTIIPWADYIEHATFDPLVQQLRFDELMAFARDLHEFMRDHAKLTESEKPLLVSGTLLALRNKAFAKSFDEYTPQTLQKEWMRVIKDELEHADIPKGKNDSMTQPYSSIAVHPELGKATNSYPKGVLHELIKRLNEKVWPFISIYHNFDVVGQFYGEFLKYTGGDKKALGIVLTPRHITELFALLANVNKDSKVLDICAGTGGFLISAMHQMMRSAQTEAELKHIKSEGLIGVEQQPNMYALAASNMILRGDGKANLHQGSCFDDAIVKSIKEHQCTVGLLNPPFSQSEVSQHELYFVKHMLDCLQPGGIGIAVVPMSCVISPHVARAELLKVHTLEAVMSLPDDIFYPVGVVVFTAHKAHATSNRKTWFGFWKHDGFVKTKQKGRTDLYGRWPSLRDRWVEMFRNREVHAGESVMQMVTADDEWCAEAYLETDYSKITQADFEKVVRNYAIFRMISSVDNVQEDGDAES
jgi:type I restriction enzyme M protein